MMEEMSDIGRYVQHNHTRLTLSDYNEVDALILAKMSYFKFETIYGTDCANKKMRIKSYAYDLLSNADQGTIALSRDERDLLYGITASDRFENCIIHSMQAENDQSQWGAVTVDINDSSEASIIAMRGTDSSTLGWQENLELIYSIVGTDAQKLSAEYLKTSTAGILLLTGHSKGGNNVCSAYVMSDKRIRDRVRQIDNFDGSGINTEFAREYAEGYAELEAKTNNYYPENSIVGMLLKDNPGTVYFVESAVREKYKEKGIWGEHDAFAYTIDKENFFKKTDQSELSEYINAVLDGTLDNLSQRERYTIFMVLDKFGVDSFLAGEKNDPFAGNEQAAKRISALICTTGTVPAFYQKEYTDLVNVLVNLYDGVLIFSRLSGREKIVIMKMAGLIAANSVQQLMDRGMESIGNSLSKTAERIKNYYHRMAEAFVDVSDNIAQGINDFCEGAAGGLDGVDTLAAALYKKDIKKERDK